MNHERRRLRCEHLGTGRGRPSARPITITLHGSAAVSRARRWQAPWLLSEIAAARLFARHTMTTWRGTGSVFRDDGVPRKRAARQLAL